MTALHSDHSGSGTLCLVVGASGVGKDTLIDGARAAFAGDARVVFARRVVTRPADAGGEAHEAMDPAAFAAAEADGAFLLSWRAHGLRYGLPRALAGDLAAGRLVVANASRSAIGAAEALGVPVAVLHVTARLETRAARLAARGRESAGEVAARLSRAAPLALAGARLREIANDADVETGRAAFCAAVRAERARLPAVSPAP